MITSDDFKQMILTVLGIVAVIVLAIGIGLGFWIGKAKTDDVELRRPVGGMCC